MNNDFCNAYLGQVWVKQISEHAYSRPCSPSLAKRWIKQLLALC